MKVLQINSHCGVGSTGRIATDIHKILINEGHESYIAYGREPVKNCDTTLKIGSVIDNYTHVLKTRLFDQHGFGSKNSTLKFIEAVSNFNPDIVHLHNVHGYYVNIEILFTFLKKLNKPVIWTLHDCWAFTGHCAYFEYVSCDRWKSGCYDCPQIKEYPSSLFVDNSKRNYEKKERLFTELTKLKIVTPSKWLSKMVGESFLKEYPVEVINNGIDLDIFKPSRSDFRTRLNLNDKYIILGVAGIWDRRKGLKYLLELSNKIPDDSVIIIVGLTDKQKSNLPKNVIGIARTNSINELAEIYSEADVFVNPTLEDNFPTTNLEALACGTPIITFDTGGSVESIYESCGYVVEKGNIEQLLNAIQQVKENGKEYYSKFCRNVAEKNYNNKKKFKEYINLYNEMYNS